MKYMIWIGVVVLYLFVGGFIAELSSDDSMFGYILVEFLWPVYVISMPFIFTMGLGCELACLVKKKWSNRK